MRITVALLGVTGAIGWLVAGLLSGLLLPLGAIMLYVMSVSFAGVVCALSRDGELPAGGALSRSRRRTLLRLAGATVFLGISAIVLHAIGSSADDGVFAIGGATAASLLVLDAVYALGPPNGYARRDGDFS
jgi:hypothetical protein